MFAVLLLFWVYSILIYQSLISQRVEDKTGKGNATYTTERHKLGVLWITGSNTELRSKKIGRAHV